MNVLRCPVMGRFPLRFNWSMYIVPVSSGGPLFITEF